ncbi:MAG: tRNA uridine-5-carboxymethylaminomethyl(34) synthesis GTPase MnmE [Candidatus Omnitrophota bacterium]
MRPGSMDDTIAAISTPIGEGGIAIVRLSGPAALKIAGKIFVPKDGKRPSAFRTYTVHYGHVVGATVHGPRSTATKNRKSKIVDEVLLTVMRAPKSYTKEDVVEINCHGGIQAAKNVLELTVRCGARVAQPGEFTKRAFMNGRIDLVQAEAVLDVIRAKTERSVRAAMGQLEGGLSERVNGIRDAMVDVASHIEVSIDFPDEEARIAREGGLIKKAEGIVRELKELSATFDEGAILREGVLAVICGKPNVGKSSLMNLLLKRDRVIVTPEPGTTRDAVEEMINLKGIPIRLADTAGITETGDAAEREGVRRSRRYMEAADIALLVLDGSGRIDGKDMDVICALGGKKKIVVINKTDLARKISASRISRLFKGDRTIEISVEKRKNIKELEGLIAEAVWHGGFVQGEGAMVTNARHKELLDKALDRMLSVCKGLRARQGPELVAIDLKEAVFSTGLIVGSSVSDEVLDRIFEQFCIGK